MDRDRQLKLVCSITEEVLKVAAPEKLADLDDDFAQFAAVAGVPLAAERVSSFLPRDQELNTTLVAGMFYQVIQEARQLPAGNTERAAFVRRKAKDFLVNRLAGQITLSQFYRLLNLIEEKVEHSFRSLDDDWAGRRAPLPDPEALPSPAPAAEIDRLRQALTSLALPEKGRRKITPETLAEFLRKTRGQWFRLLDLEAYFRVNKKTAWSYLNLLLGAAILEHNGEKANRVRYALAAPFRAESPPAP